MSSLPYFCAQKFVPIDNQKVPEDSQKHSVVLVTGGSSGIGKAIASYLSDSGFRVYGTSRSAQHGDSLANFKLVRLDVTDDNSIQNALDYIIQEEGQLDILVNNAGLGMLGPLENTSSDEARAIFDTNVFGILSVCRNAIPHLRKSENPYIINITSIGGRVALPFRGVYCASKFAVEGLTEALSMELRTFGIRVCLIEPGDFKTNINANRRMPQNLDKNLYGDRFGQILERVNAEVHHASDPILIGKKVLKIINTPNPKLRYKVATFKQKLSITLQRFLPGRVFERMMMKHYDLND
jgi:NAD(P)-dependent dehydrogenase (short-subunit alcohol dehydrogenase family)